MRAARIAVLLAAACRASPPSSPPAAAPDAQAVSCVDSWLAQRDRISVLVQVALGEPRVPAGHGLGVGGGRGRRGGRRSPAGGGEQDGDSCSPHGASLFCGASGGQRMDALLQRPTPLLRWRGALLKLESLRPGGGADDRALGIFPQLPRGSQASLAATTGGALAAAGWARRLGVELTAAVHGALSHEMREALRVWGARFELLPSREAAMRRARELPGTPLPPLDGPKAAAEYART